MDKHSWIGIGLIAIVLIGFSVLNRPSKEELARRQEYRDSVALAQQQQMAVEEALAQLELEQQQAEEAQLNEEEKAAHLEKTYGIFAPAVQGEDELFTVENSKLRLTFSTKGGALYQAELKEYKAYGDTVNYLSLFKGEEREMYFTLDPADHKMQLSKNLYFERQPVQVDSTGAQVVTLRLKTTGEAYIDFVYTIPADDYMVGFAIRPVGTTEALAQNTNHMEMHWTQLIPQQEKGRRFEERYAQLQYMFVDGDIDELSESKNDDEQENAKIRWVAYKDQFFSTVMIADAAFESTEMKSELKAKNSGYIKEYSTTTEVMFDPSGEKETAFRIYLGPNHYNTLKAYDEGKEKADRLHLKSLVPLGWKIVSWVNTILVIPMFDLFTKWGLSIGVIILLMTIVIKLIIFPFTFKSYQSTAKMRALKPQMDAINEKYPEDKMQERQQATMALYSKYGISPMSGCLPMLLQMPVVMAMFWFFPTAIELRGQSFLWAQDLSTYDAIIEWQANIPLLSWAFNNHLSLFTLLFTTVNIVYTYLNMQSQAASGPGAGMMKWMMYLMPVFFFFMFNDYAAGLSYYYFLSLLITILQTMIFRWTLTPEKMQAAMEKAKEKKANKKKSGWRARIEQLQREQQARMREQIKEQSKKQYK